MVLGLPRVKVPARLLEKNLVEQEELSLVDGGWCAGLSVVAGRWGAEPSMEDEDGGQGLPWWVVADGRWAELS